MIKWIWKRMKELWGDQTVVKTRYKQDTPDVKFETQTYQDGDVSVRKTWMAGKFIQAYFKIRDGEIHHSDEIRPEVFGDYDANDRLIGVEIIHEKDLNYAMKLVGLRLMGA